MSENTEPMDEEPIGTDETTGELDFDEMPVIAYLPEDLQETEAPETETQETEAPEAGDADEPTVSATGSRKLRIDEITKIRYQKGHVEIHFNELRKEWKMKCPDPPHADFIQAMVALGDVVLNVMELPKREDEVGSGGVRVFQVNVTHKGEREGYILFAGRTLKHSRLVHGLQTPLMWTAHKDARQMFTDDQMAAINRVVTEAALYVRGKTGQGELFKPSDPAADGSPAGDGAAPDGELPEIDPAEQRRTALAGLVSILGKNPNPNSVARTDTYFRESISRVQGWLADGIYAPDVVREVAEELEREFVAWRRLREDEGAAGRGDAFSKPQLKKVDMLAQKLQDLTQAAHQAEAEALVEAGIEDAADDLTEGEAAVLRMLRHADGPQTLWQIATATGLDEDAVSEALDELSSTPALVCMVHDDEKEPLRWVLADEDVPAAASGDTSLPF